MRKEAESREKLTEAVILLRQGVYEAAAEALDSMENRPLRPSLDGVTALRSVGEWLALQGRWREASERFLWLLEINKLDVSSTVALDTQACGVVLVESRDSALYRKFCGEAIASEASSTNGEVVNRVLKTCLLLPPDSELYALMQPLGETVEKWYATLPARNKTDWALIPIGLWHYRKGEYSRVIELAGPLADSPPGTNAQVPTVQAILAMTLWQQGETDEARALIARVREVVDRHFAVPMRVGERHRGLWYDWVFARIMTREATILIGEGA